MSLTVEERQSLINSIRAKFLDLTGLRDVEVKEEHVGLETFLSFTVGRDAPVYRRAVAIINTELPDESEFRGRITLGVLNEKYDLKSKETELIRSLIARSLRVTSDRALGDLIVEFAPFRGGEEQTIVEPANHVILGRRGVGKSSLILLGVRRLSSTGKIPVWIDLQPYRGRSEPACIIEILREVVEGATKPRDGAVQTPSKEHLVEAAELLEKSSRDRQPKRSDLQVLLPKLRQSVRKFTQASRTQLFVFLDDAHLVATELQPLLFESVHSVLKGAGGFLNVASVRNLTRLYDSSERVGLQIPHDAQPLNLDLTLTDPRAAKDHLVAISEKFLKACGVHRLGAIISNSAVERLVWCSAGVPRDFLWLFLTAMQQALQNRRVRIGVQEVNLAVGELGQQKMQDLAADTTEDATALESLLAKLQSKCLDEFRSNSFLARQAPGEKGYELLQKLMDLRLIHLLHPSITPGKAGERYEAYLLDYSFYTGVRRRQRISELHISAEAPPRYVELRGLPKVDIDALLAEA